MAIQVLITDDHKMARRGLRGFLELDPALALLVFGSLLDLPGAALTRLRYPLPITEHGVHKVHVGVHRLAGKGLCGVRLALLLLSQLLGGLPVLLGLGAQVLHHPVKEVLGKLSALLLGRGATLGDRFVGLNEGIGELLGSSFILCWLCWSMGSSSSFLQCLPLRFRWYFNSLHVAVHVVVCAVHHQR
jgi:hypothetical protein